MTTAFSQRDERWAGDRLGTGELTLGEAGCLITAVASILADFGCDTDPGRLNAWLAEHGGYVGGNRLVFGAVAPLGAELRTWQDYYRIPANMARIAKALAAGEGALALVDARPGCEIQSHWVRLLEVRQRDCLIMDPWREPGAEFVSLVEHYGACRGWDAGRAIFVLATYARQTAVSLRERAVRADRRRVRVQAELCWRKATPC